MEDEKTLEEREALQIHGEVNYFLFLCGIEYRFLFRDRKTNKEELIGKGWNQ